MHTIQNFNRFRDESINGQELYSIQAYNDYVLFWGEIPIDELLAYLDHFQNLGFQVASRGEEGSTLKLCRK